jgi:hypothetical protein
MGNLYIFGDSFSGRNGILPYQEYFVKYTKNEDDLDWATLVSQELNLNLINLAFGGISNDKIIDSIIENFDKISKNDIIILGKTFYHRFDIPNINDSKLITIAPNPSNLLSTEYGKMEIESLSYVSTLMESKFFKERQELRFSFLKKMFMRNDVVNFFTWDVTTMWNKFETIWTETNGEILDHHWSYKGHKDFAKYILNKVNNGNII